MVEGVPEDVQMVNLSLIVRSSKEAGLNSETIRSSILWQAQGDMHRGHGYSLGRGCLQLLRFDLLPSRGT